LIHNATDSACDLCKISRTICIYFVGHARNLRK